MPLLMQGASPVVGDLNGDGVVNAADIAYTVNDIATGQYWVEHDLNDDHEINAVDLSLQVNTIAGTATPVTSHDYAPSGTLPVLYINTQNGVAVTDKKNYIQADYWLDNKGHTEYASIGSEAAPLPLLIKGRGNYSWTLKKKGFRLKLDKKAALMGMKKNKHWVILPHVYSPLSNTIGFNVGRLLGMPYVPAERPVEVVMNGRYVGLYFLTEKIRVDEDRVDILEQEDNETDSTLVTGGWLLEIDNSYEPERQIYVKHPQGRTLMVTYHSPEVLSDVQRDYISDFLNETNNAIYGDSASECVWQHIDIDAMARYYITQELMCNAECFLGSCFMSKERGTDTKLEFGPLWDMENSFWRLLTTNTEGTHKFVYDYPDSPYLYHWIDKLAGDKMFKKCLKAHFEPFYNTALPKAIAFVDQAGEAILEAAMSDYERWPEYRDMAYVQRIAQYKQWMQEKADFLYQQWVEGAGDDENEPETNSGEDNSELIVEE